jgi:SAM-dependent methyltransferase
MFPQTPAISHLDYGGGNGLLANILRARGWDSISYDPLLERDQNREFPGRFDLITAFEVFEHVPDLNVLLRDLDRLRAPSGILLFSTLISDGQLRARQRIGWWYAAPRNGHISLFSRKSLGLLANRLSLNFGSFSDGSHVFFSTIPTWARHLIRAS